MLKIGVTQKTAWFMDHRIRKAMQAGSVEKLSGDLEIDESFNGGLARFMHKNRKAKITGTGGAGKEVVMGLLDRNTKKIRIRHVKDRQSTYSRSNPLYPHQVIDHAETHVKGNMHTNGITDTANEFMKAVEWSVRFRLRLVFFFHLDFL
jgi:shikimate 5-dehydrogenase